MGRLGCRAASRARRWRSTSARWPPRRRAARGAPPMGAGGRLRWEGLLGMAPSSAGPAPSSHGSGLGGIDPDISQHDPTPSSPPRTSCAACGSSPRRAARRAPGPRAPVCGSAARASRACCGRAPSQWRPRGRPRRRRRSRCPPGEHEFRLHAFVTWCVDHNSIVLLKHVQMLLFC
jgi:hypothetical protein